MESMLWKLLLDITAQLAQTEPRLPDASHIATDGQDFAMVGECDTCSEADAVWALGATISKLSSGHPVFGGKGKRYQQQHPHVQLPSLRQEHDALTPVVHACMQATPQSRPSLRQLHDMARQGYDRCLANERIRAQQGEWFAPAPKMSDLDSAEWPEAMTPTATNT